MNKHISYKGYKQLIGDNGVTEWVKFNWLSNNDSKYLWNVVDLGTLTWSHNVSSGRHIFTSAHISDIKKSTDGATTPPLFCSLYTTVNVDKPWVNLDMSYHVSSGADQVDIVNNAYTDGASFKEAMKGVLLFYRTNWNKVDLGTLNWYRQYPDTDGEVMIATVSDIKLINYWELPNMVCPKYTTALIDDVGQHVIPNSIGLSHRSTTVKIYDPDYIGKTAEQFKAAMSGVYLYYETE